MGIGLVKGKSSVFVKEEITEGTYVAPASANDALEVLEDGVEFTYNRDQIDRNTLTATIEAVKSRVGMKNISGTIPTEFKAGASAGASPREDKLYKSLLGGKKVGVSVTTKTGNTATALQIQDADIANFAKNDVILVKQAGAYELRPISAVDSTLGSANITLAFALENGAPSDNVVIEAFTKYYHTENAPTLSFTHYIGGEIEEKVTGVRCVSASLENWSTAQLSSFSFAVEGLNLLRAVGTPAYTPDFSGDALPPVLLNACVYINGAKVAYNDFSINIENTKADMTSACSSSGKIGSRFTLLNITGEINPYMENDDVDRFNLFNNNADVSIFALAYNPSNTTGEGQNYVAIWLPQASFTQIPQADLDGIITDNISFKAHRAEGEDSIFLSFI